MKAKFFFSLSKYTVQVKSISVWRLWFLTFKTGFPGYQEQYQVWTQDFQIPGGFFALYSLDASHLAWNNFLVSADLFFSFVVFLQGKKKAWKTCSYLFCQFYCFAPLAVSDNFWFCLVMFWDTVSYLLPSIYLALHKVLLYRISVENIYFCSTSINSYLQ